MSDDAAFARLEVRLDELNRKLDTAIAKMLDDHEARIRSLERWKAAVPASLLVAAGGVAAALAQ